jgi:hypothetical protein
VAARKRRREMERGEAAIAEPFSIPDAAENFHERLA